jgi:acetyl esterase
LTAATVSRARQPHRLRRAFGRLPLAPEHRFPASIEDARAATSWAAARFAQVAVGGDSAGGNLAAAVPLGSRDARLRLAHQVLVYPVLDTIVESQFYDRFRVRYRHFLVDNGIAETGAFGAESQEGIRCVCAHYVPDPAELLRRDASPLRAISLAGVAPATIVTAEHDVLRGDSEAYAERLHADGVAADLIAYAGQVHGFFHQLGAMADARSATERVAAALSRAFRDLDS